MTTFLKRSAFLIFYILVYGLTLFFVPTGYYIQWAAGGLILLVLWVPFTFRIIPGRRRQAMLSGLTAEYLKIRKTENEVREAGRTLSMVCPACQESNNYWAFLDDGICPKCSSGLWSTTLEGKDELYAKLLRRKESVDAFYSKVPGWLLRKLKNLALYQEN